MASRVSHVRLQVQTEYIEQFSVQATGSCIHREYWIPAEELAEFNSNIVGQIDILRKYKGICG
jgi:hypothetical protein